MQVNDVHIPVPGFYRVRLRKDAPWSPVKIWTEGETDEAGNLIEDLQYFCEVNGRSVDPWRYAERVNLSGEAISEADYRYMIDMGVWARAYAPDMPEANPDQPIDLSKARPLF